MPDMSAIVGAGFPRPTGWVTRPERMSVFPSASLRPCVKLCSICVYSRLAFSFHVSRFTFHAPTCRPAGALRYLFIARSINMPPLCGEKRCHYLAIRTYAVDQSVPWEKRCHGDRLGNLCLRLNLYGRMSKLYAV